jgi:Activator of Hsp90 ATPase, N-terminal
LATGLLRDPGNKEFASLLAIIDKSAAETAGSASPHSTTGTSSGSAYVPSSSVGSVNRTTSSTLNPKSGGSPSGTDNDGDCDGGEVDGSLRGYRKRADGTKTTFFNRELSEKEKELIGSIAPRQIESEHLAAPTSLTTGSSVWNSAGTFEEKVFSAWASSRLNELLTEVNVSVDHSILRVSSIVSITGDASITTARMKRKHIYDFSAELALSFSEGDDLGKVTIQDITADCDYEIEVSLPSSLRSKSASEDLKKAIVEKLSSFDREFKAK